MIRTIRYALAVAILVAAIVGGLNVTPVGAADERITYFVDFGAAEAPEPLELVRTLAIPGSLAESAWSTMAVGGDVALVCASTRQRIPMERVSLSTPSGDIGLVPGTAVPSPFAHGVSAPVVQLRACVLPSDPPGVYEGTVSLTTGPDTSLVESALPRKLVFRIRLAVLPWIDLAISPDRALVVYAHTDETGSLMSGVPTMHVRVASNAPWELSCSLQSMGTPGNDTEDAVAVTSVMVRAGQLLLDGFVSAGKRTSTVGGDPVCIAHGPATSTPVRESPITIPIFVELPDYRYYQAGKAELQLAFSVRTVE